MPDWSKVKDDPVKRAEHNERCKKLMKEKYDTDPEYRKKKQEYARNRIKRQKQTT